MLIIRKDQMLVFERRAEDDFVGRLAAQLSPLRPNMPASDLHDFIRSGIAIAKRYRFMSEAEVGAFLTTVWQHFGALPTFPRAALSILHTYTNDTAGKLARFESWAIDARRFDG